MKKSYAPKTTIVFTALLGGFFTYWLTSESFRWFAGGEKGMALIFLSLAILIVLISWKDISKNIKRVRRK